MNPTPTLYVLKKDNLREYLTPARTFTDNPIEARIFFNMEEARAFTQGDPVLFHSLYLAPLVEVVTASRL